MQSKQERIIRIKSEIFVLLYHARTDLERHSIHADTRLFHHGRNATGGERNAGRVGNIRPSEAGSHPKRGEEPEVRVPGRGVAHLSDFLPDRPGGGRALCLEE